VNNATTRWPTIGVNGVYQTYGGFSTASSHANGCNHKREIYIDRLILTDRRWHTDGGLHVGDTLTRLVRLYPTATDHRSDRFGIRGWWLHEVKPPTPTRHGGDLVATVREGHVTSLVVVIQAEGD
jgi:hypothetical protein